MTVLIVISIYLALLLGLGLFSGKQSRGTSKDYFVASHSIGPFLLLMSVFGTTMTAFALVGSTGKAFERGIGVYGLMASISGLVHVICFFAIGIRLWSYGMKHGFVTQIQFFRSRFDSNAIGYVLFPILVGLVIPYLLIGVIGAGKTILPVTAGAFPEVFPNANPLWTGGIPPWLSGLGICIIVLAYVFAGGSRGAAWANTFQTLVFMAMGVVAFTLIVKALGGVEQASKVPITVNESGLLVQNYGIVEQEDGSSKVEKLATPLVRGKIRDADPSLAGYQPHLGRKVLEMDYKARTPGSGELVDQSRELGVPPWMFLTYLFIPLSVGMFPHLFQHWLTARSANTFKLTLIAHPICIMVVWVPCVLIGAWATGLVPPGVPPAAVLSKMMADLVSNQVLTGLLTAGVLAAIMSSLDSQFLCLGTMFTNDIVLHKVGQDRFTDKQTIWIARGFIIGIVALTYVLSLWAANKNVFDLAVWCFSGFAMLTPLVFAALYWKRATTAGAFASIIVGTLTWIIFFVLAGGSEYTVGPGIMPVTFCVLASTVAMIVVSLATKPPSEATLNKFFG
ncbi:MAG: sodium:solute symporter family protein [Verrucomicrobiales bacterium]|nr:sodium:solute symporter family protein [Verrucomicrobiales bacterium]